MQVSTPKTTFDVGNFDVLKLEFGPHPADHLQHDSGTGLLEHGHRGAVGHALQAVSVDGQQPVTAL